MIDATAHEVTNKPTFVPEDQQIRIGTPATDPFSVPLSIAFTGHSGNLKVASTDAYQIASHIDSANDFLEEVIARCRRDVDLHQHSARAHMNLGLALRNHQELDEAIQHFRTALGVDPVHYLAMISLARVLTIKGEYPDAQAIYLRIREIAPDDISSLVNLAYLSIQTGDMARAIEWAQEAVKIAPESVTALYALGIALLINTGHVHEAVALFRRASRRDVHNAAVHQGLGVAYLITGDTGRAAKSFQAALNLIPAMPEAAHALALVLIQQRRFDRAIGLLDDWIEAHPSDYHAKDLLASAYVGREDYDRARKELYKALRLIEDAGEGGNSEHARLIHNLGICYWRVGNMHDAANLLVRAIDLQPDASPVPYQNLARWYLAGNLPQPAEQMLRKCLEKFPADHEALLLLATALNMRGNSDRAIAILQAIIDRNEGDAISYSMLGSMLADKRKDLDAALSVLRQGHSRFSKHATLDNNLAYVHLMRGEVTDARSILKSVPLRSSDHSANAVALTATWGLLSLWEGDLEAGRAKYREAELLARSLGYTDFARIVLQKMRLEVGRFFGRSGDWRSALREVQYGLSLHVTGHYDSDLKALAAELAQHMI